MLYTAISFMLDKSSSVLSVGYLRHNVTTVSLPCHITKSLQQLYPNIIFTIFREEFSIRHLLARVKRYNVSAIYRFSDEILTVPWFCIELKLLVS